MLQVPFWGLRLSTPHIGSSLPQYHYGLGFYPFHGSIGSWYARLSVAYLFDTILLLVLARVVYYFDLDMPRHLTIFSIPSRFLLHTSQILCDDAHSSGFITGRLINITGADSTMAYLFVAGLLPYDILVLTHVGYWWLIYLIPTSFAWIHPIYFWYFFAFGPSASALRHLALIDAIFYDDITMNLRYSWAYALVLYSPIVFFMVFDYHIGISAFELILYWGSGSLPLPSPANAVLALRLLFKIRRSLTVPYHCHFDGWWWLVISYHCLTALVHSWILLLAVPRS